MSDFNNEGSSPFGFHFHLPGILNPLHTLNPVYQAKHAWPFHHHGHHQVVPHPAIPQSPHGADMACGYSPYGAVIE